MANATPSLGEVIRVAVASRLADLHVSLPALVEAYDASKQTVDVVPLLMFPQKDGAGNLSLRAPPKVVGVPVVFAGGGGARMTFPVKAGDFCTLLCSDRSIDVWKGNGSATPVDPGVDSSHALVDAIAFVGLRPPSKPWSNAPTDRLSLGYDTGARVEIGNAEIDLGAGATEAAIKGNAFKTALDTLISAIGTAVGTSGTPAGATASAAAIAAAQTAFDAAASSFLSTLVKLG